MNIVTKTFIKSARELAESNLTDLTISSYETQVFVVRTIYQLLDKDGVDIIKEIREALNIIQVSMSACDSELDDFSNWEFKELLEKVLDNDEDDTSVELPSGECRLIDKDAIDQIWHDSLIEQIKDCYDLSEVPSFVEIDWDKTAENCKVDGLGHHFSSYDGNEHSTESFYIFRTN